MDPKLYLQKLVNTNLDFLLTEIVPLIKNQYAGVAAAEVIQRLKETVVVVTDGDPDNESQLKLIWGSLSSDPELVQAVRGVLLDTVSKIDEPILKEGLSLLVTPVLKTITAVTDQEKPDGAQLKSIWKEFVESPEFLAFILSNLEWIVDKVIKDENVKSWILRILKLFIN